ncbi:hypothetical protein QWJ34_16610 [Saccharibacillus sp. CPCC 101409]|uniref:hypothetical protein n=1 Tax=Saccharibacillus sp. CPCC 101409 TaxID=3058041 RepID=UPI002671E274|nr:hypothetical protein [Saccharibacillus sp. CPCC 101409]MDO3411390.1 hypothetical protein [Saccharibacillus sp. CPCC 101409]
MTNTHEEDKLLRDAEQSETGSRRIEQMELNTAVRRGIDQGKKRAGKRRAAYGLGAGAAAAAIIAVSASLIPGGNAQAPQPAAVNASSPLAKPAAPTVAQPEEAAAGRERIEDYMGIGMSTTYSDAIIGGYMTTVDRSFEQNGFKVTLRGEAMDSRRMYLIVSVENGTAQNASIEDINVDFGEGIQGKWILGAGDYEVKPGEKNLAFMDIELDPAVEYPEKASLQFGLQPGGFEAPSGTKTAVEIPFDVQSKTLREQTETIAVDRDLTVDGQNFHVDRLELSPLGTYLDYSLDESNTQSIFSLIAPKLVLTGADGGEIGNPQFVSKFYNENTLAFESGKVESPDSIVLSVDGISAADLSETKLVLNTKTGEIVSGGGGQVKAVLDKDKHTLTLEQTLGESNDYTLMNATQFRFGDTLVDAEGVEHDMFKSNGGLRDEKEGKLIQSSEFKLGEEEYAQPVTLTLNEYWSPIEDKQELELKP